MENNNIKCTFCTKTFTQKKSLYAHCRKFHDTDIIIVKPFSCRNCDIKFMTEKTLSAHNKNFHKKIVKTKNQTRIICPLENCEKKFLFTFKKLREHINYDHNIEIEYEERYFCDISEFEKWKLETEQQTSSMYTLNRAASKLRDGSLRNLYYCHRSYHYRKQGNDTRSIGSNKIGRACPAMLRVTVSNSDKTVYTQFWKTHCGHVEEIVRTRLDNETRTLIAGSPKMNDSFDRSSRKRKKSPSINSTKQKRVKSNNASSVKSLPKQKPIKLDDASSILSLTPSMAYGVTEEYNSDDDLMSIAENEGSDNFIKLDMSQLTRDNGVLFSEDLTEDYEVWTMQCPTDVNIMDLHKKSLNFNDVSTLEIKNSMSGKVDLIPYKSQKDTNITIVIPSEKTKNLSLNVIPLAGTIIMSNRVKREKLDKNNQKIIPVDTIEDAARRRSQLMSKITQRLSNKYNIDTTDKTNIKIENISPKKVKKNKKLIN